MRLCPQVFKKYSVSGHLELQQRSCEYLRLSLSVRAEVMESVLNTMPTYPEDKENILVTRLRKDVHSSANSGGKGVGDSEGEGGSVTSASAASGGAVGGLALAPVKLPAAAPAPMSDLLSLDDDDLGTLAPATPAITRPAGATATAPVTSSIPLGFTPDLERAHENCIAAICLGITDKPALLLDCPGLKVDAAAEFRAHMSRVTLFLANTSSGTSDSSISDISVVLSENADINMLVMSAPPTSLPAISNAAKVQLQLECRRPFADSPRVTLSYSFLGGKYVYPLQLPITPFSFCEPVALDGPAYMVRWKALEGDDREAQEIFTSGVPITTALIARVKSVYFPALHVGMADGLDSETTATGSCSFRTNTPSPDGSGPIVIGALMRLEGDINSNRFRVTVRAKHGKVAKALKATWQRLLSAAVPHAPDL